MASTPDGTERFASVRQYIRSELVEQVLPSLAVAVAQHGIILWEEGFGWADRENRVPATADSLYSLASITKPMTATGLMALQSQGKIDLDRPIDDYLGDARLRARVGNAAEATVRRVANHTSGLPLHYHFFYADEPHRPPPFEETIRRYANLVTAPGERYMYSNLGYGILDHVIARLSGQRYADFMRREVFLPLGMPHASIGLAPALERYQAIRYGADGVPYPFYDFDHPGASAAFCSAHDLVRFGMFHLKEHLSDQKAILPDEIIDQMQVATFTEDESGYGIGWSVTEDEHGYRTIQHGGGMGGVNTILLLIPSERIAVAVLANGNTALPWRVTEDILAVLLPDYGEKLAAKRSQDEEREQTDEPEPFKPDRKLIGEWQGSVHTWAREIPLTLLVKKDGDIHARLGQQLKTLVNEPRFEDAYLTGQMLGDIGTEDANRRPYRLNLDLKLRGRVLNGVIVAQTWSEDDYGGAPERRVGNGLSYWTELRKSG